MLLQPTLPLRTAQHSQEANAKFERRFRKVEAAVKAQGKAVSECNLMELDAIWHQIKSLE